MAEPSGEAGPAAAGIPTSPAGPTATAGPTAPAGPTSPAGPSNAGWFARAQKVIPGGVNSPVRAFRSVGGTPYFVARGQGAYVWDEEGRRYLDYVQSYGASILGHAHPKVVEAVKAAAAARDFLRGPHGARGPAGRGDLGAGSRV